MLGREIADPEGIEGNAGSVPGLGHLDVITVMKPEKHLALTQATYLPTGDTVSGYEIHLGETTGPDCSRAWLRVGDRDQGATSPSGRVRGCYLHGLFSSDAFRAAILQDMGAQSDLAFGDCVEATLESLASHIERHLNLELLMELAETPGSYSNS